jgi:hypothetical protein
MPFYRQTIGGHFYKDYKNGNSKRVSEKEYLKNVRRVKGGASAKLFKGINYDLIPVTNKNVLNTGKNKIYSKVNGKNELLVNEFKKPLYQLTNSNGYPILYKPSNGPNSYSVFSPNGGKTKYYKKDNIPHKIENVSETTKPNNTKSKSKNYVCECSCEKTEEQNIIMNTFLKNPEITSTNNPLFVPKYST